MPRNAKEPIKNLEDAREMCADLLRRMDFGEEVDPKMFTGLKTFVDIEVNRLKSDPNEAAKDEFARSVARKAAESIDLNKAREILLSRNFRALEDHAGIVDVEVERVEGEKTARETMKLINEGERRTKKR